MSKIVVIGGIESTYRNAQTLFEMGEEIAMFYTRGPDSAGWEGVDMIDESKFSFSEKVPKTIVNSNINNYVEEIEALEPDFIWSLGWQQLFKDRLLNICSVIGIHESLLPAGAGPVPIANAILHDTERTGITLFEVDKGMDTGHIIFQLQGLLNPRKATATQLYDEAMELSERIIKFILPFMRDGTAPRIPQDMSKRTTFKKIKWEDWPEDKVSRARTYPYA